MNEVLSKVEGAEPSKILTGPRGEMDITTVFGTVIRGSNPLEGIDDGRRKCRPLPIFPTSETSG